MAPEADRPTATPDANDDALFTLTRALRFLEGLAFCCLSAVVILWLGDRTRDVGFDPVTLTPCSAESCRPDALGAAEDPWRQFTQALDQRGLVVLTSADTCAFAVELLRHRATDPGTDRVLSLMQDRGTITLSPAATGALVVAPGRNNDGFGDVLRDAFRWQGTRGCHPMRYAPVFWPLWTMWMLLINLRLFRYGQSVWAKR